MKNIKKELKVNNIPSNLLMSLGILVTCFVLGAGILFISNRQKIPPVKTRLHNIGNSLPTFDGHKITDGEIGDGNCFGINEAANLPALNYQQAIAVGTFKKEAEAYKQSVTASQGITWSKSGHFYDGAQSDPFTRDGKRYTLTVIEYSTPENNIGINLTACDY